MALMKKWCPVVTSIKVCFKTLVTQTIKLHNLSNISIRSMTLRCLATEKKGKPDKMSEKFPLPHKLDLDVILSAWHKLAVATQF